MGEGGGGREAAAVATVTADSPFCVLKQHPGFSRKR